MLPDFTGIKRKRSEWFKQLVNHVVFGEDPLMRNIRSFRQYEAKRTRYDREGSPPADMGPDQAVTALMKVDPDNLPALGTAQYVEMARGIAQQMLPQHHRLLFERVKEACDAAGTSRDAKDQPLTPELLLGIYETVTISFTPDGQPDLPTAVMHPDMERRFRECITRIASEPPLRKRMDRIIENQRLAWRDRESNRRLVD